MRKDISYNTLIELIKSKNYTRINIIGSPGAGKSTMAKIISKSLGYKLIDLDLFLYTNAGKRKSHEEDIESLRSIISNSNIVIDGTYTSSLEFRVNVIDLFILKRTNRSVCLFRFLYRLIVSQNIKLGERLTFKTFYLIIMYSRIERERIIPIIPKEKLIIV
jgi:Adenylate kinase and related kinases